MVSAPTALAICLAAEVASRTCLRRSTGSSMWVPMVTNMADTALPCPYSADGLRTLMGAMASSESSGSSIFSCR